MTDKTIYLSGAITNIPEIEANQWRIELKQKLEAVSSHVHVFNPVAHYSFEDIKSGLVSDREIMETELYKLRRSDIVIVNFFHSSTSLGTMAELAIAYELKIPIIGLNVNNESLHPWQFAMVHKIFKDSEALFLYMVDHFINDD